MSPFLIITIKICKNFSPFLRNLKRNNARHVNCSLPNKFSKYVSSSHSSLSLSLCSNPTGLLIILLEDFILFSDSNIPYYLHIHANTSLTSFILSPSHSLSLYHSISLILLRSHHTSIQNTFIHTVILHSFHIISPFIISHTFTYLYHTENAPCT